MGDALVAAELYCVRLPLVTPFRAAHGTRRTKDALLVRVVMDDDDGAGDGWGECSAETEPTYMADTIESSRLALRDHLLPRAFAGAPLDDVRGHAPARAALECALLDAQLRRTGVSLASHLGAARATVPAGVAVGLYDDEREFRALLAAYAAAGYRRVKCKIEPGRDVGVVQAARAELGDGIEIAVDANGSYSLADDEPALRALDEFGLQCIEQPLAPDALLDHASLAARLATRVCLDESVTSATVARDAVALGAAQVVSLKSARLGGLDQTRRVHDVCVQAGVPALAGGMLETGVGRAALLAVAALPGCTETGDCSATARYFAAGADVTEPFELVDGALRVPRGPGLGVDVQPDRLAAVTIARERITP
jgi:O-succinylbenzoate synthase